MNKHIVHLIVYVFLSGGMKMINYADANKIQDVCLNHYSRVLSKSGKAKLGSEWTVLSAIVMLRESGKS